MRAPQGKQVFVVDTNVLINFAIFNPIDLSTVFWAKMETSLKNDDWVLLDVVVNEVQYPPELKRWCQMQKNNGLMKSISAIDRARAVEINNQYKMIDQSSQKSTVDTYLIAYAEANHLTVFSRESPKKPGELLNKIPDVCSFLMVSRIKDPSIFLNVIGYKN